MKKSRKPNRSRLGLPRYQPWLELLQSRILPSIDIDFSGGTLTITGDDETDEVTIVAEEDGTVTVEVAGEDPEEFENVDEIEVDLGTGGDTLNLEVSEDAEMTVDVAVSDDEDAEINVSVEEDANLTL